ncbi:DUF5134 domain-containing protein [Streptomyces sp. A3M-1-3]|uniref:DUF5134 domain-containing protein n=1 Tax=Streptomyces sp. A3M-1-3 TaxID=2962044 RepID=UPI0020B79BAA|nr:DUF5134 domain-containing protein [Streptomyces sp. A3M-1-3]MCP3818727.1 DUF5134 domain-containing protein [Streptomyces sp. A3M-1-3]
MHGPVTSAWLLVALCAATGAYCLLRLRSPSEEQRSAAGSEAVMGFGMAAMAVPTAVAGPPEWAGAVLCGVFGVAALRALWLSRLGAHHLHHLVGSLVMVYMAVAMLPGGAPAGHGAATAAGGVPLLTGVLLAYYGVYVLRTGAGLLSVTAAAAAGGPGGAGFAWGVRPEVTTACRLAMGIGMFAMLLAL